jgi:hypothetical protein
LAFVLYARFRPRSPQSTLTTSVRLADDVVQGVRMLDRFNGVRFRGTPEVLAAWGAGGTYRLSAFSGVRPVLRI